MHMSTDGITDNNNYLEQRFQKYTIKGLMMVLVMVLVMVLEMVLEMDEREGGMVLGMEDTRCVHNTFEVNDIIFSVTWII